jgi:ABC-type Mn2+/Zn2+ transport system ATPase subunit
VSPESSLEADLLRLESAAFGYDSGAVVSGVDLVVHAGDFLGIVGPNGAGKTTLFRGILGLIAPLSGTVQRSVDAVGYVPQRDTLDSIYPLAAHEVVEMGAFGRLRGLRRLARADRARARALLERVALGDAASLPFSVLSGGQRQRVLIARALMVEPQVLLLDEPTTGVDRKAEILILELLRELNREGLAVLLVSHQLSLVRDAVRTVLWVSEGRVHAGTPDELLHPENLDRLYDEGVLEPQRG